MALTAIMQETERKQQISYTGGPYVCKLIILAFKLF
jgi:hypothetical protein